MKLAIIITMALLLINSTARSDHVTEQSLSIKCGSIENVVNGFILDSLKEKPALMFYGPEVQDGNRASGYVTLNKETKSLSVIMIVDDIACIIISGQFVGFAKDKDSQIKPKPPNKFNH